MERKNLLTIKEIFWYLHDFHAEFGCEVVECMRKVVCRTERRKPIRSVSGVVTMVTKGSTGYIIHQMLHALKICNANIFVLANDRGCLNRHFGSINFLSL